MRRFFLPPANMANEEITLSSEILHHLGAVLRLSAGEEIVLLDGLGNLCRCRIESLDRRSGKARVLHRWREEESALPVCLLQALPKGDKMDLVLQKGTELGVSIFVPVLAGRSISRPGTGEEKRLLRWERIVREAARQCRRPCLPHLTSPLPLAQALSECNADLRLMLWEEESRPLAGALPTAAPRQAAILVGPEGGFSSQEAELARRAGFLPVRIGPRILRTETAGFAVASILQYLYGDLGPCSKAHTCKEMP
jgi:16S rRNA (uracil1498-N3)-methyltransferase